MQEYDPQFQKDMNLLDEIVCEIRDMAAIGLEEDIKLLKRGWNCENGERVTNICKKCQDDLFNVMKNIGYIKDSMGLEKC